MSEMIERVGRAIERPADEHFTHHGGGEPGFDNWVSFLECYGYASPEVIAWLRSLKAPNV